MSRHYPVVGVSGKKRSGKDTFAEVLIEEFGYTRVAFADPMKAAALALDPIIEVIDYGPGSDPDYVRLSEVVTFHGWEGAKDGFPEVRRTLQRLGTEMGRKCFGEDFWVEQGLRAIAEIDGPVVVTDVRFPNEADAIRGLPEGELIRIERYDRGEGSDEHPSEIALDGYAFLNHERIDNDGSIEELHEEARRVAREMAFDAARV